MNISFKLNKKIKTSNSVVNFLVCDIKVKKNLQVFFTIDFAKKKLLSYNVSFFLVLVLTFHFMEQKIFYAKREKVNFIATYIEIDLFNKFILMKFRIFLLYSLHLE